MQPFIASTLKDLYADNYATGRSLGIIKPNPGSITFAVKPHKDADANEFEVAKQVRQMQQSSVHVVPVTVQVKAAKSGL